MFMAGGAQQPFNFYSTSTTLYLSGISVKLSTPVGRSRASPDGIAEELNAAYTLRAVLTKARKGNVSASVGIGGKELVYISSIKPPIPAPTLWVFVTRL